MLLPAAALPQDPCENMGFENGDFSNWVGSHGCNPYITDITTNCTYSNGCCPKSGIMDPGFVNAKVRNIVQPNRHALYNTVGGKDSCGQFPVVAPGGGNFSVRLGNADVIGQAERLMRTFTVSAAKNSFTYQYAVVMQNPTNHAKNEKPFFEIVMFDQAGDTIPCSYYFVVADSGAPGFFVNPYYHAKNPDGTNNYSHLCREVIYKPWASVTIDLSAYVGQNVTIRFTTADCAESGHYGYAYIDASCEPLKIEQKDSLCAGASTQLTAPPGGTSYSWTGPGGFTASTQNVNVSAAGTYFVTIDGIGVPGCSQTISTVLTNYPGPATAYTYSTGTCGYDVSFVDASTYGNGNIISYNWLFGDGTNSTLQNPKHTYSDSGTYNVSLIITTDNGCVDTLIKQVKLLASAAASFTADTVCVGSATNFTDASVTPLGLPDLWTWQFGDGNTSSLQNPTHMYADSGQYNVSLIIKSGACIDTVVKPVYVMPPPQPSFTASPVCLNSSTVFTDMSTYSFGTIDSWLWNFGEPTSGSNNISTSQNPSHTYVSAGLFNVTLTVASGACKQTKIFPVNIHPLPVADFIPSNACIGETTSFTDQSAISSGTIVSWSWNFGDSASGTSNLSSQQTPLHLYSQPGTYNVLLTVTSQNNCQSSITKNITIGPKPTVSITGIDVCFGQTTFFTDTVAGTVYSLNWNFGDGQFSSEENPGHVYSTPGSYDVLLIAGSGNCSDSDLVKVNVFPVPTADFSISPNPASVLEPNISFSDLSTGAISGKWDLGDGDTLAYSAGDNFMHNYEIDENGTGADFSVALWVQNAFGCPSLIRKTLKIEPYWTFYMPDAFTPNEDDMNAVFFGKGVGIKEYKLWVFDRWGNLTYHCDIEGLPQDERCWWDGKVQNAGGGQVAQQEVYVWLVELTDVFNKSHKYTGHVTLVK